MDVELEDLINPNNTDDLNTFSYHPATLDFVLDITLISFAIVGFISDLIIIYMIACNARMRSKTNLLLMNFIINDALYLVCNIHLWADILEILGSRTHYSYVYDCVLEHVDIGFQANESVFLLIIVSNTLIKSKRIELKTILIVVYSIVVANFIFTQIYCRIGRMPLVQTFLNGLILLTYIVVLFKELNNCYKKWYKLDPLSERTKFRLNIGRIYVACWLLTSSLFMLLNLRIIRFNIFYIFTLNTFLIGFYVLIYLVKNDKNFKICFLNLLRRKDADDYGVDNTITFADDLSEDSRNGDQNHMKSNATDNAVRFQPIDTSTVQVS